MAARSELDERLEAHLLSGDWRPGQRLPPERALAAELGVSRSSLRESMRRLIDLGVLEPRRGSGTYVAALDFTDLVAVRLQLEPLAARLAARRRTSRQLDRLADLVAAMGTTIDQPDRFAELDGAVHATIVEAAHSPALAVTIGALSDLLRHSRSESSPDAALRAAAVAQHLRLLDALERGDGVAAAGAMTDHLSDVAAVIERRADVTEPRRNRR